MDICPFRLHMTGMQQCHQARLMSEAGKAGSAASSSQGENICCHLEDDLRPPPPPQIINGEPCLQHHEAQLKTQRVCFYSEITSNIAKL